jgi:hypothetical protein
MDKPVFLKRKPKKRARIWKDRMVMKKPAIKDDRSMIMESEGSAVFESPRMNVPINRKNVIIMEIKTMSSSFDARNSVLLMPVITFCLMVLK